MFLPISPRRWNITTPQAHVPTAWPVCLMKPTLHVAPVMRQTMVLLGPDKALPWWVGQKHLDWHDPDWAVEKSPNIVIEDVGILYLKKWLGTPRKAERRAHSERAEMFSRSRRAERRMKYRAIGRERRKFDRFFERFEVSNPRLPEKITTEEVASMLRQLYWVTEVWPLPC